MFLEQFLILQKEGGNLGESAEICWDLMFVVPSQRRPNPTRGRGKWKSLWPIFRIHHQKTRYIFDLFYKRKAISRELYEYCIKEGYADKNLIAKWKKQGYENLCCLRCIQTRDTNFGTNCICRVPKSKLEVGRIIECTHCGCRGCSG
uniref:Protein BUD31 homolog n=1 Tax=Anas platyrhynchos TaxID=8839 RepID=A0A8B9TCZ4_ANAPL